MIDGLVILFSVVMSVLVAYRAFRLDRELPWFGATRADDASPDGEGVARKAGWRARATSGNGH
jgi:hypothetical protein